jgi:hypothetical protein
MDQQQPYGLNIAAWIPKLSSPFHVLGEGEILIQIIEIYSQAGPLDSWSKSLSSETE